MPQKNSGIWPQHPSKCGSLSAAETSPRTSETSCGNAYTTHTKLVHRRNIPDYEDWGMCHLCGEIESMQYILVECKPSIIWCTVWELASKLWCRREDTWLDISFGSILGANLPNSTNTKSAVKKGCNRLFTILVLESAHLIWKLRCSWIIDNKGDLTKLPTKDEIHNKWVKTINLRLKFDKLQMDMKRYGSHAIKSELVLKTWSGIILNEENLPDSWIWESGVLVSITLCQPLGRGRWSWARCRVSHYWDSVHSIRKNW